MTNGGFLEARKTKPIGLIAIVGGHGVLLTAIALAPPEAYQRIDYIRTIVTNIRDKAPPPPEQLPPPQRSHTQPTTPTTTDPLIDLKIGDGLVITTMPPPMPDTGPITSFPSEPVYRSATMDPAAMNRFQPGYPSAMVRAGIEGLATVRILIGTDGRVKTVELVTATDPAFFEATRTQALRYWRFQPATRDGVAIESSRTMTVKFRLES